ncbi:hypothetical protein [Halobacillus campisalis]|uniref:Uncharacterized protein n=1 Tax=Halobacillus campisalis TaxID=435909 RepID=A0ABW2K513_9BACI|nr:hypothetical protein [Halobacillus campisalis]
MVIRLITFFMIGAVIFTLFTLFMPDLLSYFWLSLAILLVIGIGYLSYHYLKKIIYLIHYNKNN